MNGKKGDDPIFDIVHWKVARFSPAADSLIADIVQMGGKSEQEHVFDLFDLPPIGEFEKVLDQLRDRLRKDRTERCWELQILQIDRPPLVCFH